MIDPLRSKNITYSTQTLAYNTPHEGLPIPPMMNVAGVPTEEQVPSLPCCDHDTNHMRHICTINTSVCVPYVMPQQVDNLS